MKIKISVTFLLIFTLAIAQNPKRYRTISHIEKGWNSVTLPDSVLQFSNGNFSQFRLKTNNQTEIPFFIESVPNDNSVEEISLKILNKSHQNNRYFFTIENIKDESNNFLKIRTLHFNFSEENFDRKLLIEGSDDNVSWFTLANNARITSYVNQQENFTASSVYFPESNYRFYRISFESETIPEMISAQCNFQQFTQNQYFVAIKTTFQEVIKDKITQIKINLPQYIALGKIQFSVNEDIKFSRAITIEAILENTSQSKGNYQKRILFEGNLSKKNFSVNIPKIWTKNISILIQNNDNIPLTINNLELGKYQHFLYFQTENKYNFLKLFYDYNTILVEPDYDIILVKNQRRNVNSALLGKENITEIKTEKQSINTNYFLWITLGFVCVLLAFYIFRILQRIN